MPDLGRFKIIEVQNDKWVFSPPGLRKISRTGPYMYDGRVNTLEEVIDFFDRGGDPVKNKSSLMQPLNLQRQEKADLLQFLKMVEGK
ncbi:MAG: cytochrome c peroxidase [Nitrospinales bacterium]|jgi:cytochrome c peroxidase